MIRLGRMTDYAVVVMHHMARQHGQVQSTSDVAMATSLAPPTVSKILNRLGRLNLLDPVRGRNGGYRMVRAADDVSLAEIVTGFEGPIALTDCLVGPVGVCDLENNCPVVDRWRVVTRAIERVLDDLSLADVFAGTPKQMPQPSETEVAAC